MVGWFFCFFRKRLKEKEKMRRRAARYELEIREMISRVVGGGVVHMKMFLLHFSTHKGTTKFFGKRPTFRRKSKKTKDLPFLPKAEVY